MNEEKLNYFFNYVVSSTIKVSHDLELSCKCLPTLKEGGTYKLYIDIDDVMERLMILKEFAFALSKFDLEK